MSNLQAATSRRSPELGVSNRNGTDLVSHLRRVLAILLLATVGWVALVVCSDVPRAAALPVLWQKCLQGSGAGQCGHPGGLAVDPNGGSVYVVDPGNSRVNEFSPWGVFLKSWGWGVATGATKPETCGPAATPPISTCRSGIAGTEAGQFGSPQSVTLDAAGNVYVLEVIDCTDGTTCLITGTNRVQKFDSDGNFILMFGKEVNLTKVAEREAQEAAVEPVTVTADEENICTAVSGDSCGPGKKGSGPGEFGTGLLFGIEPRPSTLVATAPGDKIEVAGQERIQVFDKDGHYERTIPVPGKLIRALAVDGMGNSYVASLPPGQFAGKGESDVIKLGPSGAEICRAKVSDPRALAVDELNRLYVVRGDTIGQNPSISFHRFSSDCVEDNAFAFGLAGAQFPDQPSSIATSSACGITGNLYYGGKIASGISLSAYYPAPDRSLCPPPPVPPLIADQYAVSAGATSAVVRASINPRFWPDTTYYVEFGTEDCSSAPDACERRIGFPGAALKGEANDEGLSTAGVFLPGLQPNTTYYYRFVVQSGGGGPVRGLGDEEASGVFRTASTALPPKNDCPNQAFRSGPSAYLADCRAYEMVSPVIKDGGELVAPLTSANDRAWLNLGAGSGERATYSSYRSFANPASGPYSSQYLATRAAAGWVNESISAIQEGAPFLEGNYLDTYFKAFDDELCDAWFWQPVEPLLAPNAISGYTNLYRRQGCGPVSFETLTPVAPIYDPSKGEVPLNPRLFSPELSGFSADHTHAIYEAVGKLAPSAPSCVGGTNPHPECIRQLYHYHAGSVDLVCTLPNGQASQQPCWAGSGGLITTNGRHNLVQNVISADGSRIFWTGKIEGATSSAKIGRLYVRIDGSETRPVSVGPTRFWAASDDGSRVVYSVFDSPAADENDFGDLYEQEIDGEAGKVRIARDVSSVLGVSEDARRVYFASKLVLTGAEENSEGDSAVPGGVNLYFHEAGESGEGGTLAFIGTLSPQDGGDVGSLKPSVFFRTSRVTPDGQHAAFTSSAPLTGADNRDARTGRRVTEVFLYDAVAHELRCVSCNPTNARPQGQPQIVNDAEQSLVFGGTIPGWPNQMRPSRVLADDGQKLFFESYEPLVLTDTNGKKDVYEWEPGDSQSDCEEAGAQLFSIAEGGCISLISSGESPGDSSFIDAGRSGRDVFFITASGLVPQDPGLIDLYDAREGGGFPAPPQPPPACEGEACQGAYSPPQDPTPASSSYQGPGNVDEGKRKPKKQKQKHGKRKGKKQKGKGQQKQKQQTKAGRGNGGHR